MAPEQGLEKTKNGGKPTETTVSTTTATAMTTTVTTSNADLKPDGGLNIPARSTSPKSRKIRTTWVSFLNKAELEAYLREFGMDPIGVVEELRRRLSTFVNGGYYATDVAQRLIDLEVRHTPGVSTPAAPTPSGNEALVRSPTYIIDNNAIASINGQSNTPTPHGSPVTHQRSRSHGSRNLRPHETRHHQDIAIQHRKDYARNDAEITRSQERHRGALQPDVVAGTPTPEINAKSRRDRRPLTSPRNTNTAQKPTPRVPNPRTSDPKLTKPSQPRDAPH